MAINKLKFMALLGSCVFTALLIIKVAPVLISYTAPTLFSSKESTSATAILQRMQTASKLITLTQDWQVNVELTEENTLFNVTTGFNAGIYTALAQVTAGVDLTQVTKEDIQVTLDQVVINLPAATLLGITLNAEKSGMVDQITRGLLPPTATDQATKGARLALNEIRLEACASGVIPAANKNAKLALSNLLSSTTTKEVIVNIKPSLASCLSQKS